MAKIRKNVTLTETQKHDWDADGTIDSITTLIKTYDKKGQITVDRYQQDWNGDGVWDYDYITNNTWNKDGTLANTSTQGDNTSDGQIDFSTQIEFKYKKGIEVWKQEKTDWNADGVVDNTYTTTNTLNKKGLVTEQLSEQDWTGDGVADDAYKYRYEYDKQGRIVKESTDWGNDGSLDGTITREYSETPERNHTAKTPKNVTITENKKSDWDSDGNVDSISIYIKTYDKKGQITLDRYQDDWNADGTLNYDNTTRNIWNKDGTLAFTMTEIEATGDGVIDISFQTEFKYQNKVEVWRQEKSDDNGDGVFDYASTMTAKINKEGLVTSRLWEQDLEGDGVIDEAYKYLCEYDKQARLVKESTDWGNNGTIDNISYYEYGEVLV